MNWPAGPTNCHVPLQRFLVSAVILVSSLFLLPGALPAQTESASISGTIVDRSGGLIPDVGVTLVNTDTNATFETKTNGAGIYNVPFLKPGHYRILVAKRGFKQIDLRNVTLNVQDSVNRNFTLDIGGTSETVVVSANNERMETDNPAVGLLVNRDFVENMPLNGRSFQDLIALSPGTVTSSGVNNDAGLFSINGQHTDANYYTVDGVAANLNPGNLYGNNAAQGGAGTLPSQTALGTTQALVSVDALEEFKIQTSGYAAEYGRQPGGQIALTTRAGSNDLHGSLFDYFRNDVMDASDWFFNSNKIPKQAERQNDFGGTVGGPLEIPKLYNGKDKTFFFVSYEGLRLRQPQFSGIQDVPTLAFRQFVAPGVQPFLNAIPLPNGPANGDQCAQPLTFSCTAQWTAGFSNPSSLDSVSARVDQAIGQKLRMFVRYADTPSKTTAGSYNVSTTAINSYSWTVGSTIAFRPNLLNEARFSYSTSSFTSTAVPAAFGGAVPFPKSLLIPAVYAPGDTAAQGGVDENIPNADFFSSPHYDKYLSKTQQYNLIDSFSWSHAAHTLKFGGDFRRLTPLLNLEQYTCLLFLNSFASVQQGFADNGFIYATQKARPIFNNLSLYLGDHWKLTPRLTLDYGLRWEFNPAPGASDGLYPLSVTTGNIATMQLAPRGTPQYHTVYHDFAPRLGFAYQLNDSPKQPTVVRGGVGVFYDTGQQEGAAGYSGYPFVVFNAPTNVPLPASAAALAPPSLNSPLTPPYGFLQGVSDPNLKLPYTQQWNLSLDQGLSARNTLTVSYVGNGGRKLLFSKEYFNPPNSNFTGLNLVTNAASSSYHALQVQDRGYVTTGMQIIASYTWAHAIDNASSDILFGNVPLRGNSDNDIRHVFNVALNYEIPGADSNKFVHALTHGWSFDNRFSAQTGYPLDVVQGFYSLPDGEQGVIRPDLVGGVPIYLHNAPGVLGGWELNKSAFLPVPTDPNTGVPLRLGDLGRNYVHGPAFWNLNTAVQRSFPLHERAHLIFRVEAFNIFNHPNAGSIDKCLCDSTFGQSNPNSVLGGVGVPTIGVPNQLYATGAARSLQLMLKIMF